MALVSGYPKWRFDEQWWQPSRSEGRGKQGVGGQGDTRGKVRVAVNEMRVLRKVYLRKCILIRFF